MGCYCPLNSCQYLFRNELLGAQCVILDSCKEPDRKAVTSLYHHTVSPSSLPWWQAYSVVNLYLTYGLNARSVGVYQNGFEEKLALHPQNHRLVEVGRDLCGSSSPTPLPKQGHLQQAAQDLVHAGFEYLQRRRLHNLPGQPVQPTRPD